MTYFDYRTIVNAAIEQALGPMPDCMTPYTQLEADMCEYLTYLASQQIWDPRRSDARKTGFLAISIQKFADADAFCKYAAVNRALLLMGLRPF